jgi:hypothetical protein
LGSIERFFIDTAWLDALKAEAKGLEDSIEKQKQSAEGSSVEGESIQDRRTVEKALSDVKQELSSLVVKEIDPKEYLGFRRNLDSKKAQRMDLEMRFQQQGEKYRTYLDLVEKELSYSLPEELIKLAGVKIEGDKYVVNREGVDTVIELTGDEKISLYLWLFVRKWRSNPAWPLIIPGLKSSLPAKLYMSLDEHLQSVSTDGQVILVEIS